MLRFGFCVALSVLSGLAGAEQVRVNGVMLEATAIEHYVNTLAVSNFETVRPTTVPFTFGNYLTLNGVSYLHLNSNLSLTVSNAPQMVDWVLGDGHKLHLDCGPRKDPQTFQPFGRVISFYPDQSYKGGCSASSEGETFVDANGSSILVKGTIETDRSGHLLYTSSTGWSRLRLKGGQEVLLFGGRELNYFPNGQPHFFTMVTGEAFGVDMPGYGEVRFTQVLGQHVATILFENGLVEKGILAQPLHQTELNLDLPESTGVGFVLVDGIYHLNDMIFPSAIDFAVKNYGLRVNRIYLDLAAGTTNLILAEGFEFQNPQTGQKLNVPEGSLVSLQGVGGSQPREIGQIQIPRPEESEAN